MAGRMRNRLGEFLRFVRYLPRIYRSHVLDCQRRFHDQPQTNVLFFNRRQWLYAPNDVTAFRTWQGFFAEPGCAEEVAQFLHLRQGCQRFLDIGAAHGLFSALFARSATSPGQILGVEPTSEYARIFKETMALNAGPEMKWSLEQVALLDKDCDTRLADPAFEGFFDHVDSIKNPEQSVTMTTLDTVCKRVNFSPDLIKLDVDGFEYEILMGSPLFLDQHKPRMHFELHFADLRRRGKDPAVLLNHVLRTHRIVKAVPANFQKADVARLSLVPR